MPARYDGQVELRVIYGTIIGGRTLTHRLSMDIKTVGIPSVGTPFDDIPLEGADGSGFDLDYWFGGFLPLLRAAWSAATTFIEAQVWVYPPTGGVATFIASSPLGVAGTNGDSGSYPAQQATYTFRTLGGHIARLQLMEPSIGGEFRDVSITTDPIVAFLVQGATPFVGRDDEYVFTPLALSVGQNEKLARKRFREE